MKKKSILRIHFFSTATLYLLLLFLFSCDDTLDKKPASVVKVPNWSILVDDSYETSGKAQVSQSYLVEEKNLSEEPLLVLLKQLYRKAAQIKGWKNHDEPTVISIKLYTSKQHFISGNWIGWVLKLGYPDSEPDYKTHKGQLENLRKIGEVRWGLTEKKRVEIYTLLDQAQIKALENANKKFLKSQNPLFDKEYQEIIDNQTKIIKKEIGKEFKITDEQISNIKLEGFYKNWSELHSYKNPNEAKGVRWELTEKKRMEIYALFGQAHIEALNKADIKYPDFGIKHDEMSDSLTKTYRREISRMYNLSKDQVSKIFNEGRLKNWPSFNHPESWPEFHHIVHGETYR